MKLSSTPFRAKSRARVAAKLAQRQFVAQVAAVKPEELSFERDELVEQTRSAKSAHFLSAYRRPASSVASAGAKRLVIVGGMQKPSTSKVEEIFSHPAHARRQVA